MSEAAQGVGVGPHANKKMIIAVGVISPAPAWVMPRTFVDDLRRAFPQHTFLDAWDRETIRQLLPQADVAFTPFVDRDLLPSLKKLRWVQSPAAGVGSLMFPELLASDIVITSARGVRARSIAEHVIGVTIALLRRFPAVMRAQAAHRWAQDELEGRAGGVRTLQGLRMGIIGLGAIGGEVARLAAPLGLRISGVRRHADQPPLPGVDNVVPPDRLVEVLFESDIVVVAAPHTLETKRLIGPAEVDAMKPGAILINVARGKMIDDAAVVAALRDGRLGGAALDVFAREPLESDSPYWDLPNVIITPHVAGSMQDYWTPLVALFSENLRRFARGEPLINVVDKAAGY